MFIAVRTGLEPVTPCVTLSLIHILAIVKEAIYRTENVGLVIIDGIRDMVYDINSPGESTKVISLLMTWTEERNIHIHTILHQNKGDENARGHIGTELSNKAETVLQVEKDSKNPDISTVKTAHIRAVDFEPFAFRINEEALPELLEDYQFKDKDETKGNREKFDPYKDITERQHRIALEAAFTLKDEYGYQELAEALQEAYASVGATLGGNKVVKLITVLKSKRMIVQENGRKYKMCIRDSARTVRVLGVDGTLYVHGHCTVRTFCLFQMQNCISHNCNTFFG